MAAPEGDEYSQIEETPEVGFDLKEQAMDEAPVGITITDPDLPDNPLVYVNDAFVRMTGYSREESIGRNCRFLQGERTDEEAVATMREAIEAEEPVTVELVNYRKNGESFWNEVTIAPVRDEEGEVSHYVGFQSDVTERKRAEIAVEQERRNLEHLLDRINGLLSDVTLAVVQGDGREEIERTVCDRIVAADPYDFAWIGELDIGGDRILANAFAGDVDVTAEDLAVARGDDRYPAALAVESGEVEVVEGDATAALSPVSDRGGIAAVPLSYGDTVYGVLVVHAPATGALNERETAVLEALGRTIATALNAHESKRIISADNVVEIELEVRDRGLFFVDFSARLGCSFEYRGSVYREGAPLLFFSTDADPADVIALAEESPGIDRAAVVGGQEGASLIEFRLSERSIVTQLADRGANTRSITATDGEGRIEIELSATADARSIIEYVQETYPETSLVGYHERERPPTTKREFIADLEDKLTDRQLTALQKAYVSGYYEWNRTTSGDELAESMGISRSTFHQHLRAAERKLVAEFFDRGYPTG